MDSFELAVIELLARGGLVEADILRQMPAAVVVSRTHDQDRRETRFRVPADGPANPKVIGFTPYPEP